MCNYTSEERYYLWLSNMLDGSHQVFDELIALFGSAEGVFRETQKGALGKLMSIAPKYKQKMQAHVSENEIDKYFAYLKKHKIKIITSVSHDYPELLSHIPRPPEVLYYIGNFPKHVSLPIAVIGPRECTEYGRVVTKNFVTDLCKYDVCIISGLARGIDAIASRTALDVSDGDCPTMVVLGSGVNVCYPAVNRRLYDEICERGVVMSEFPPNSKPLGAHFPIRNRIIAGLSRGVLVTEASRRSGALITADFALDFGRDVFCVPGRITDENSLGVNNLLTLSAAKPVHNAADILVEYNINVEHDYIKTHPVVETYTAKSDAALNQPARPNTSCLTEKESKIVELLKISPRSFDELYEISKFSLPELNSVLTTLEFSEIIKQLPGRSFELRV